MEEKDPKFDAMLSQMVGRIQAKPGGKLEMGEVSLICLHNFHIGRVRHGLCNF